LNWRRRAFFPDIGIAEENPSSEITETSCGSRQDLALEAASKNNITSPCLPVFQDVEHYTNNNASRNMALILMSDAE